MEELGEQKGTRETSGGKICSKKRRESLRKVEQLLWGKEEMLQCDRAVADRRAMHSIPEINMEMHVRCV